MNIETSVHRCRFDLQRSTARSLDADLGLAFIRSFGVHSLTGGGSAASCGLSDQFTSRSILGVNWSDVIDTEFVLQLKQYEINIIQSGYEFTLPSSTSCPLHNQIILGLGTPSASHSSTSSS